MSAIDDWQEMPLPIQNINDWQEMPAKTDNRVLADQPGYVYGDIFPLKKNISTGERSFAFPEAIRSPIRGIQDLQSLAENQSTDMTPDSVSAMISMITPPNLSGMAKTGASIFKTLKDDPATLLDLLKDSSSGRPGAASPNPIPFNPIASHQAIGEKYEQAKNDVKPAFDFMKKQASGMTVNGNNLISPLKNIISDINLDPFHEGRMTLPTLQRTLEQLESNPNIPLNDVVEMRQNINSNFNQKRFSQDKKGPYFDFANALDTQMNAAGKKNPFFGQAKDLAYDQWLNTVEKPFQNNPVLNRFWRPEDYWNYKGLEDGRLKYLPDETSERANTMVSKIGNADELKAVTRVMPQEVAQQFNKAKYQDITQGSGAGRFQSLGKAGASLANLSPLDFIKHTYEMIEGPQYTPLENSLMAATKQTPQELNTGAYKGTLHDLIKKQQELMNSTKEGQAKLMGPEQPLALPQATRPMVGGRGKELRPATDEEWQNMIDRQRQSNDSGLTYDVQKAQQQARVSQYATDYPANQFFNQIGHIPMQSSWTALDPKASGMSPNIFTQQPNATPFSLAPMLTPEEWIKLYGPK